MQKSNEIYQKNLKLFKQLAQAVSAQQRSAFYASNRVLLLTLADPEAEPRLIAKRYTEQYGTYINGDELNGHSVIEIYKKYRFGYFSERKKMMHLANHTAELLENLLRGNKSKNELYPPEYSDNWNYKLLVLLALVNSCQEVKNDSVLSGKIIRLNKGFAAELLDNLIQYLFTAGQQNKNSSETEALRQEISLLRYELERKRTLLLQMQESFDEQLEESRLEEQADIISQLNSAKYGYILDMLASAQRGFIRMRDNNITIPMEIRGMRTLVRKLQEFVGDCGVTPMLEVGTEMVISAADMDGLQYEGEPFVDENAVKRVMVISPGWQITDREIVISYPRVREMEEYNDGSRTDE